MTGGGRAGGGGREMGTHNSSKLRHQVLELLDIELVALHGDLPARQSRLGIPGARKLPARDRRRNLLRRPALKEPCHGRGPANGRVRSGAAHRPAADKRAPPSPCRRGNRAAGSTLHSGATAVVCACPEVIARFAGLC